MKSTGIVRRVVELGRIVLPIELRRSLSIAKRDPVEIFVDGQQIILKKYQKSCTFCGGAGHLETFKDRPVCGKCLEAIRGLF